MRLSTAKTISEVRRVLLPLRSSGGIGLVPTMGALHAGHASLIARARQECAHVVVSIFVNPLQFGANEDYQRYPRPLSHDLEICEDKGTDVVFAPGVEDMYPSAALTQVDLPKLTEHLCGKYRPGHFKGVATVVLKLFNIIQPDRAYFGEKDYQQLCIIKRMVQDLDLPLTVVPMPTYREADGLAMSSRNVYLSPQERSSATILFRTLQMAREMVERGEQAASVIRARALEKLSAADNVVPQYLEIVDPVEVQPVSTIQGPVRIAGAIWLGKTRLIDNIEAIPNDDRR